MNKLPQIILLSGLIAFGSTSPCASQVITHQIKPGEAYDNIDIARHDSAIAALNEGSIQQKQQTVNAVLKNPNYYNPRVIYALSKELFAQGKQDEAMYWFYVAQLRARYDANLCLDVSARQATSVLTQEYGPDINQYAFKDISKLRVTVKKVVEFVRNNNEDYDHRWINLHGMGAVLSGLDNKNDKKKELTEPKSKWPEIKKKTVDDYYNGFLEAVKDR